MKPDETADSSQGIVSMIATGNGVVSTRGKLISKGFGVAALAWIVNLFLLTGAHAANWYVQPSSAGAGGTNWNNAWSMAQLNANWSSVKPGDTVWLSGGTYTTALIPASSGTAGNPIYIKRVLATDSVPTNSPGWKNSFDSQVVITPSASMCIYWNQVGKGSWLSIDGRQDSGISCYMDSKVGGNYPGAVSVNSPGGYIHDVTIKNVDMGGPSRDSGQFVYTNAYDCGFSLRPWSGGQWLSCSNWVLNNCRIHGALDLVMTMFCHDLVFDHCKFYDNNDSGATTTVGHANMYECNNCYNLTFRYCDFSRWMCEGFRPYGAVYNVYIYGCFFHDAINNSGANPGCVEPDSSAKGWGPIYFYNNTVENVFTVWRGTMTVAPPTTNSQARNNLYWNASESTPITDSDYTYANASTAGAHSINGKGATPFVNAAATNYQIVATVAANYPKDKGQALSAISGQTLNLDMNGYPRGADGAWDIGAYEYGSISTNSVITVSPPSFNNFGSVWTNTPTPLILTVSNASAGTVVGNVTLAVTNSSFQIISGGNYILGANQYQKVIVIVNSSTPGTVTNTILLNGGGTFMIPVSGTAVNSSASPTIKPLTH
jgi:hypothetical protein